MEQNILEQILDGTMKPNDLPFETLRNITDNFSSDRIIGEGGFGTVYKGVLQNRDVAVKKIASSMTIDEKFFRGEVNSLMEVNHQNVVKFLGFCSHTEETAVKNPESRGYIYAEKRERLLCFEYISNGSLDKYITDELRGLEWDTRYQVIKGICTGLYYIHMEKHILHMDLKPANILLDNQMVPKITDFGLARHKENSRTTANHYFSRGYAAPENVSGHGRLSVKSDIYSLGTIIIELVSGCKSINGDKINILRRWRHRWNKSATETPVAYQQQVIKCTEIGIMCQSIDPYSRPSIEDIMKEIGEMERTNNCTRNSDEPTTDQINDSWEDDMLGIEPLELRFSNSDHNNKLVPLSCSVELSNNTNGFIAFKIEKTNPLPYYIYPNNKIVPPKSKLSVNITLSEATQHHYQKNKEQFLVRSTKVNENLATKDVCQEMLDKGTYVDEVNLTVVHEICSHEEPAGGTVSSHNSRSMPTQMKLHTLNVITNDFSHEHKVGSVGFADVYQGLNALTAVNSTRSRRFSSLPCSSSARGPLDVVIVYAFDCSTWTPAWYTMDNEIFWLVQEKLTKFTDSCMGYIYVMLSDNTYTCDMKIVDSAETRATGYTAFDRRRITCYKNMASGLSEAHKMINNRGYENGIILLFSDGLENKGDFFDGAENFESKVPVHTFTLDGDAYNHVLYSIAENSLGGKFHTNPVPERPLLSTAFSKLLDNILDSPISGRGPLDVVIVYAFDCTDSTPAWHTVDSEVFWLLQEKLTHFPDSCMGYIYVMSTPNTYTSDMKLVDPTETRETGYTGFARRRCTKNMASGLAEAHKMIGYRGHGNGIILFFSDGLVNEGDFFDGTENFVSKVPVHTFTLGGDAYNHGLKAIADKSPGGTFNPVPVPERPRLSVTFSKLLDRLLSGTFSVYN